MRYAHYLLFSGTALMVCLVCATPALAEQVVRCRSHNYEYEHCPAREHGRVRLIEQISKSACIEGRTWGYDRRGVWVDKGCDAKFRITSRARDDRNRGTGNRRAGTLTCRSESYAYNHCRSAEIRNGGTARVAKQLSKARCTQNESWGMDRRGIWVNHGCEAEFRITPRPRDRVVQGKKVIRCRSEKYEYEHCQADTRAGVRLVKQRSKAECVENQTWGSDRHGIWVDRGCDAEFQVVTRQPSRQNRDDQDNDENYDSDEDSYNTPPPVIRAGTLECRSDNNTYRHCRADTRNGVQLARQFSRAACIQGETWGYNPRGVWVNHGCEAEFRIGNPVGNALENALDSLLFPQQ